MSLIRLINTMFDKLRALDFLAPLTLRLYLAPIFILAGMSKLSHIENVASWFESLGFPLPTLMVWLAGGTELIGGICLVAGFAVRWVAIPLMVTMVVWWEWRKDLIDEAVKRKEKANEVLQENRNYEWITEAGPITILKNGIEFAATYFIMLLVLFFMGAGKYLSIDYYLRLFVRE